ncbi:MAG: hypothetical protein KGZ75_09800 [Syntrophomonadaceae bacterium]|nr:hypothetical protein [Syntrophomonadaceae bacterium]
MDASQKSRGGALVTVLLVLTIMITLGGALLTLAAGEFQIADNQAKGIKAFYLAEAGLALGASELINNSSLRGTVVGSTPLGEGRIVSVTVTDQGTHLLMRSTGEVGGVRRVVTARVQVSPFSQGLMCVRPDGSELVLTGSAVINGNIVFGQNIDIRAAAVTINGNVTTGGYVENNGRINGNVTANGSITNTGTITGTRTPNANVLIPPVPLVDLPYYQSVAKTIINGDVYWTAASLQTLVNQPVPLGKQNVIFVNGDVELTNKAGNRYSGQALVVATGEIEIEDELESASWPTHVWGFATRQTIELDTTGHRRIEGLFHAGTFEAEANVTIRGGIVSDFLELASNPNITIDSAAAQALFPVLQSNLVFTVLDWKEGH